MANFEESKIAFLLNNQAFCNDQRCDLALFLNKSVLIAA